LHRQQPKVSDHPAPRLLERGRLLLSFCDFGTVFLIERSWLPYERMKIGMSEAQNVADRSALRTLWRTFPHLSAREYARRLGRSESWARTWIRRFETAPTDATVIFGRSRVRHHLPPPPAPEVIAQILDIRDHPPDRLQRIPGPKAILYYLPRRLPATSAQELPRSTRTIWQILRASDRIRRAKEWPVVVNHANVATNSREASNDHANVQTLGCYTDNETWKISYCDRTFQKVN
jgi:hypothetical protein